MSFNRTTLVKARESMEKGIDFIDTPVSSMESRAIDGTLTVMCGGEKEVFERIKPLLEYIGKRVLYRVVQGMIN